MALVWPLSPADFKELCTRVQGQTWMWCNAELRAGCARLCPRTSRPLSSAALAGCPASLALSAGLIIPAWLLCALRTNPECQHLPFAQRDAQGDEATSSRLQGQRENPDLPGASINDCASKSCPPSLPRAGRVTLLHSPSKKWEQHGHRGVR